MVSIVSVKRPHSPTHSIESMKTDNSKGYPLNFKEKDDPMTKSENISPKPTHSIVSIRTDDSKGYPLNFREVAIKGAASVIKERPTTPTPSNAPIKSDQSMGYPVNFGLKNISTHKPVRPDSPIPSCMSLRSDNSKGYPLNFRDDAPTQQRYPDPIERQQKASPISEQYQFDLCERKMKYIPEGSAQQNNPSFLSKMYTDLIITEGGETEVNYEHEVRQIERSFRSSATQNAKIDHSNIFKPLLGQQKDIRTVLTNGIAGIGKTATVEKLIQDWHENKIFQDIELIIQLPFRELNLLKRELLDLTELLQHFLPKTKDVSHILNKIKVMLILDGLDESRIPLDFTSKEICTDVTQQTSVDVLLTNLINRNLLPSALLWITTRPAAACQIPAVFIDRVTEIRGFNDLQKAEYFQKRINDENLANRIIAHLKSCRSLYIMCYIPIFCWIAATVLERLFSETVREKIPKTLTQMYMRFLITQTNIKNKYTERKETNEEIIFKLGKLAFEQLEKGNLIFYEEDLRDCAIDMKEASLYSGVCTQIFREESGLHKGKLFCFVHLSIQEFLAALYVHISFVKDNKNIFKLHLRRRLKGSNISNLHEGAINMALLSENGHFDLFLRFLLGFSTRSNQTLLRTVLPRIGQSVKSRYLTVRYIRQKIKENALPKKSINLFHCLNELSYQPLIEEVQNFLCSNIIPKIKLSSDQWAALVFILLTSDNDLAIFDLSQYMGSNEAFQKLLPVVEVAKQLLIRKCNLTEKSCEMLADVLRSKSSSLQELDLSGSQLPLQQVKLLCSGLKSEDCKLKKLRLNACQLDEESCAEVVSAFISYSASLKELDMTNNQLSDSVVKTLSETLKTQKCQLEVLRLRQCGVKPEGFKDLTSALQANPSHLKELDLSMNKSGDAEVQALCEALNQPQCRLQILKLNQCELTHTSCSSLASIMGSESSSLLELHLSDNKIQDTGVEKLAAGLEKGHCKLEVLKLYNCNISAKGCGFLASALRSNPSHLRELYLNWNHPIDPGTNPLTELLERHSPDLKLEKLDINPPIQ